MNKLSFHYLVLKCTYHHFFNNKNRWKEKLNKNEIEKNGKILKLLILISNMVFKINGIILRNFLGEKLGLHGESNQYPFTCQQMCILRGNRKFSLEKFMKLSNIWCMVKIKKKTKKEHGVSVKQIIYFYYSYYSSLKLNWQ